MMTNIKRRIFHQIQSTLSNAGFSVQYFGVIPNDVPNRDLYAPTYQPWRDKSVAKQLRVDDLRSLVTPERKWILIQLLKQAASTVEGSVVEAGVYKGGTAFLMAQELQKLVSRKQLFLLDSFAGMPETRSDIDVVHREGDFSDTSLEAVQRYLSEFANVHYVPGHIPASLKDLPPEQHYCFVHIDLDIYEAIRDATRFFYERTNRGGFLIYDDYGHASCPGARQAVDEFFADKPERPLALTSGQCIVFKT